MTSAASDHNDPQRLAVYAAEDALLCDIGPRFTRWTQVEAFVERVIADSHYLDLFPNAPLEISLQRRSRSATYSAAVPAHGVILIRDGSWNAVTILHELAHLVCTTSEAHGPRFVATELSLVRRNCSFDDYLALRESFAAHGVRQEGPPAGT